MAAPTFFGDVRIYESTELASSPIISLLFNLINATFTHGHTKDPQVLPPSLKRLEQPQQLIDEIGPHGFVIVMFASNMGDAASKTDIIGTTSAKPYSQDPSTQIHASDTNMFFKRKYKLGQPTSDVGEMTDPSQQEALEDDTAAYELIAMAVSPSMQRQGIATKILNLCINEIIRRSKLKTAESTEVGSRKVNILISTVQETSEGFYAKKGWRTTDIKTFEPGVSGSVKGFHIANMIKTVKY